MHAIRRDGFDGEISPVAEGRIRTLTLGGGTIPAGQDQVRVTLSAPRKVPEDPLTLHRRPREDRRPRGRSQGGCPPMTRCRPSPIATSSLPSEFEVCLRGPAVSQGSGKVLLADAREDPAGRKDLLEVALPTGPMLRQVQVELERSARRHPDRQDREYRQGPSHRAGQRSLAKVKPGLTGNLVVAVFAERSPVQGGKAARRRFSLGTLPAVPLRWSQGQVLRGLRE